MVLGDQRQDQDEKDATNPARISRVFIGKQIAGRTVVGQASRLLVAAAVRAAYWRTGRID